MSNPVIHFEVTGRDGESLRKFYSGVFGWTINPMPDTDYGLVEAAKDGIGGGIGQTPDGSAGLATFYVGVPSVSDALDEVTGRGGSVVMPEMAVAEGVTIGLFADPEGHVVGVVQH